jgi:hypothetical protein
MIISTNLAIVSHITLILRSFMTKLIKDIGQSTEEISKKIWKKLKFKAQSAQHPHLAKSKNKFKNKIKKNYKIKCCMSSNNFKNNKNSWSNNDKILNYKKDGNSKKCSSNISSNNLSMNSSKKLNSKSNTTRNTRITKKCL